MAIKQADAEGDDTATWWQCATAEFFGTFLLTFVAAGADVMAFTNGGTVTHFERYLAPALLITAMIWSLSGVSGAHLNPAVTVAFTLRKAFSARRLPLYIVSQLGGGVAAAFLLLAIFGDAVSHGVTHPTAPFDTIQAFVIEAILSLVLVFTILATAEEKAVVGKNAALAVGSVIALGGLAFSPVSGASMNPARSIGPMVATGQYHFLWLYVAGPFVGAGIAVLFQWLLLGSRRAETRVARMGNSNE